MFMAKIKALFKPAYYIDFWMIDDNTMMPIACGNKETAYEVVKEEFNGEYWRIYGPVRKWYKD